MRQFNACTCMVANSIFNVLDVVFKQQKYKSEDVIVKRHLFFSRAPG